MSGFAPIKRHREALVARLRTARSDQIASKLETTSARLKQALMAYPTHRLRWSRLYANANESAVQRRAVKEKAIV